MQSVPTLLLQGLQIVWINILLSGDNAVVIALACRGLVARQRRWAVLGGSFAAVALRIVFSIFVVALLKLPYVKIFSGLMLLWIAFDLLRKTEGKTVTEAASVWSAIRTIALADAIMSLDNVVAVAAAAKGSLPLIVFGIAVSVPLIVFGSTLVLKMLERFPFLVIAGAALLGWIAGEIAISDPRVPAWLGDLPPYAGYVAASVGAALILLLAAILRLTRTPKNGRPVEIIGR